MNMNNFNKKDRSGSGRDYGRGDFRKRDFNDRGSRREMFKAVCSACGRDCEIPFEPRDGRPVYCSDCFEKKEGGSKAPRDFHDRGQRRPDRPDFERKDTPVIQNNTQLQEISNKLDKILEVLTASSLKKEAEKVAVEEKKEPKAEKKISKVKKKKPSVSKK